MLNVGYFSRTSSCVTFEKFLSSQSFCSELKWKAVTIRSTEIDAFLRPNSFQSLIQSSSIISSSQKLTFCPNFPSNSTCSTSILLINVISVSLGSLVYCSNILFILSFKEIESQCLWLHSLVIEQLLLSLRNNTRLDWSGA